MTITNANFDDSRFIQVIKEGLKLRDTIKESLICKGVSIDKTYFSF